MNYIQVSAAMFAHAPILIVSCSWKSWVGRKWQHESTSVLYFITGEGTYATVFKVTSQLRFYDTF